MSRIISGLAGSIRLSPAPSGTRPTSDRVKESLFASLETKDAIDSADVLDLFAGSGALGLEALSRGARSLVAVELARPALDVCVKNAARVARALSAAGVKPFVDIRRSDAFTYLAGTAKRFSLVIADPPYNQKSVDRLLPMVAAVLKPGGYFVIEMSKQTELLQIPSSLEFVSSKSFGLTQVSFFRA